MRNNRPCHRMPMDEELLPHIGRVAWMSARLHHAIRDKFNELSPNSSVQIFDYTLGMANKKLREIAQSSQDNEELVKWCDNEAREAIEARNGLLHAVAFTTNKRNQALQGTKPDRPREYTEEAILDIADLIFKANSNIPT